MSKNGVLTSFAKFIMKCGNFIIKRPRHKWFVVNFAKVFESSYPRTPANSCFLNFPLLRVILTLSLVTSL